MARGNVPNLGQKTLGSGSKPGGSAARVPAGQGSNAQVTRGGPPVSIELAKQTKGGRSTVNSQPSR